MKERYAEDDIKKIEESFAQILRLIKKQERKEKDLVLDGDLFTHQRSGHTYCVYISPLGIRLEKVTERV